MKILTSSKGLTLIELVMIIGLLGIAIPILMSLFGNLVEKSSDSLIYNRSQGLFMDMMEEVRSKKWDENVMLPPGGGGILMSEGLEIRNVYNDIDDYNGLNNIPPRDSQDNIMALHTGFGRSVFICYVEVPDLNTCVVGPTDYKKVSISVKTPIGPGGDVVGVMGNWR